MAFLLLICLTKPFILMKHGYCLSGAPMIAALRHVDDWIFDLDNTLYPASARLFDLIDQRMSAYVARILACDPSEARRIQKQYFRDHGTTLAGLMMHHGVDPDD